MAGVPLAAIAGFAAALAVAPAVTREPPQASTRDATDAAGRKLITTLCGSCHTAGSILGTHRAKHDWEEVLEWMIDEGAVMNGDEFEQILGYLSVRYGRVDINSAPAEEIRHVLELTEGQTDRIVSVRGAGRRFATLQDVADAAGAPVAFFEARKTRITFGVE